MVARWVQHKRLKRTNSQLRGLRWHQLEHIIRDEIRENLHSVSRAAFIVHNLAVSRPRMQAPVALGCLRWDILKWYSKGGVSLAEWILITRSFGRRWSTLSEIASGGKPQRSLVATTMSKVSEVAICDPPLFSTQRCLAFHGLKCSPHLEGSICLRQTFASGLDEKWVSAVSQDVT